MKMQSSIKFSVSSRNIKNRDIKNSNIEKESGEQIVRSKQNCVSVHEKIE